MCARDILFAYHENQDTVNKLIAKKHVVDNHELIVEEFINFQMIDYIKRQLYMIASTIDAICESYS
jgi:hypothetical protein